MIHRSIYGSNIGGWYGGVSTMNSNYVENVGAEEQRRVNSAVQARIEAMFASVEAESGTPEECVAAILPVNIHIDYFIIFIRSHSNYFIPVNIFFSIHLTVTFVWNIFFYTINNLYVCLNDTLHDWRIRLNEECTGKNFNSKSCNS